MPPELEETLRECVELAETQRRRMEALRVALRTGYIDEIVRCAQEMVGMRGPVPLQSSDGSSPLIDAAGVSKLLRLPLAKVYMMANQGSLPAIRSGRKLRFDEARIRALVAAKVDSDPAWPTKKA